MMRTESLSGVKGSTFSMTTPAHSGEANRQINKPTRASMFPRDLIFAAGELGGYTTIPCGIFRLTEGSGK
jgi:hypothetical protein